MQARALVIVGHVRQPVRRLERELAEDLHLRSRDPEVLVGLQAQPPLRMFEAVLDGGCGVRRTVRAVHRLEAERVEVEVLELRRDRRRLAGTRASVRRPRVTTRSAPTFGLTQIQSIPAGPVGCRWSRPRRRSPGRAGPRPPSASSCRSGSPPVQTTMRWLAVDLPARRLRPRRPARRRREAAAARAVGADEVGVAELADRPAAVAPRGRSTGCSARTGRTPPAGRRGSPSPCRV